MINRKLMYVKWKDSRGVNEHWQRMSDISGKPVDCCIVESIGFVIREDINGIHLAPHTFFDGDDSQFCGDMQIPTVCIVQRKELDLK